MDVFDIIELALNVFFDFDNGWYRFYGCTIVTVAAIGLIQWRITNQTIAMFLSVPIAIIGIGWGIAWEWRSRH